MNWATEPNSLEILNYTTTKTKKSQICSNCPILLILCSSFISETVKITHDTYIFYEHNISNFKKRETFIQVN